MADSPRIQAPDAHQLNVLIRMLSAPDPVERNVAGRALRDMSAGQIADTLKDPFLAPEAMDFFAHHSGSRPDWVASLLENPALPDNLRALLGGIVAEPKRAADDLGPLAAHEQPAASEPRDDTPPADGEVNELTLSQKIQKLSVGQKVKWAMKGDKEVRNILIKDTNREVYMAVLNNPGLKENEVEMLTKNTGTSTEILRHIGRNREWMANAGIMKNLILNSKTPVELSIRFLPRLSNKDLDFIEKSRNLPSAVRSNAKRLLSSKRKG